MLVYFGMERGGGERTYAEPVDDVAVGWVAGAAGELLLAGGVDDDGVVEGACGEEGGMLVVGF